MSDASIKLEAKGFERMMRIAPLIVQEELRRGLTEASMLAEREIKERTPTSGAGTLRDSIGALPVEISGTAARAGVGTSLSYAAPVEFGSKPHWAPLEPLVDWVRRKLGIGADEAEGVAELIRFKIAAYGTKGAFMFRDGLAAIKPQVERILEEAAERATRRIDGGER